MTLLALAQKAREAYKMKQEWSVAKALELDL